MRLAFTLLGREVFAIDYGDEIIDAPEGELDYSGAIIVAIDQDPELAEAITDQIIVDHLTCESQ